MFVIFDLDGTVINSGHRHSTKPDGSIDLKHWFDNVTAEKVAADTLLPLVHEMREMFERGMIVIICTARCFTEHDWKFLEDNNIPYSAILHREGYFVTDDHPEFADSYHGFIGDGRGDGEMKVAMLNELAETWGFPNVREMGAIMFDDNKEVIAKVKEAGVYCFDAVAYNRRLSAWKP